MDVNGGWLFPSNKPARIAIRQQPRALQSVCWSSTASKRWGSEHPETDGQCSKLQVLLLGISSSSYLLAPPKWVAKKANHGQGPKYDEQGFGVTCGDELLVFSLDRFAGMSWLNVDGSQ